MAPKRRPVFPPPLTISSGYQVHCVDIVDGRTSSNLQHQIQAWKSQHRELKTSRLQVQHEIEEAGTRLSVRRETLSEELRRASEIRAVAENVRVEELWKTKKIESLNRTIKEQGEIVGNFSQASFRDRYSRQLESACSAPEEEVRRLEHQISTIQGARTEDLQLQISRQKLMNDAVESDLARLKIEKENLISSEVYPVHEEGKREVSELLGLGNAQTQIKQLELDSYVAEIRELVLLEKHKFINLLQ
jgi:hypothetical protein